MFSQVLQLVDNVLELPACRYAATRLDAVVQPLDRGDWLAHSANQRDAPCVYAIIDPSFVLIDDSVSKRQAVAVVPQAWFRFND